MIFININKWFNTHWEEISYYLGKIGQFDFTILPLLKNPVFIGGVIFIAFVLLMLRLLRTLAVYIGIFVLLFAWSFLIASYNSPEAVPFVNWWILVGIGVLVIGIEFYICLIVID